MRGRDSRGSGSPRTRGRKSGKPAVPRVARARRALFVPPGSRAPPSEPMDFQGRRRRARHPTWPRASPMATIASRMRRAPSSDVCPKSHAGLTPFRAMPTRAGASIPMTFLTWRGASPDGPGFSTAGAEAGGKGGGRFAPHPADFWGDPRRAGGRGAVPPADDDRDLPGADHIGRHFRDAVHHFRRGPEGRRVAQIGHGNVSEVALVVHHVGLEIVRGLSNRSRRETGPAAERARAVVRHSEQDDPRLVILRDGVREAGRGHGRTEIARAYLRTTPFNWT